jgi:hypothetical protein
VKRRKPPQPQAAFLLVRKIQKNRARGTYPIMTAKTYNQRPQPMQSNSSPWTEVFQPTPAPLLPASARARANRANTAHSAHSTQTTDPATRDALSASFNQD